MLRDLQLNHCDIGDDGALALAEAVRDGAAPSLQNLWLGGNLIGDSGAAALAQAITPGLSEATGLRRLGLYSNQISDGGALALGHAVEVRHDERQRLRADAGAYDLEGYGRHGDGELAVLTVMLFGHRIVDEGTVQHIERIDRLGMEIVGDRIELYSLREDAFTFSPGGASAIASPVRRTSPIRHEWSSPDGSSAANAECTWSGGYEYVGRGGVGGTPSNLGASHDGTRYDLF